MKIKKLPLAIRRFYGRAFTVDREPNGNLDWRVYCDAIQNIWEETDIYYPMSISYAHAWSEMLYWDKTDINKNNEFIKQLCGPYGRTLLKMHQIQAKEEMLREQRIKTRRKSTRSRRAKPLP